MAVSHQKSVRLPVPAQSLLYLARGFSCMFWGVPAMLLMMVRTTQRDTSLGPHIPLYALSLFILCAGFGFMLRVQPLSRRWKTWAGSGFAMALFMGYFAPFLLWWHRNPFTPFYLGNMLALLAVSAGLLYIINRLSAEAGRSLGDPTLFIEARICSWTALLVMLPLISAPVGLALHATESAGAGWVVQWVESGRPPPLWAHLCLLFPVALTMTTAWKAKEHCLDAMVRAADASAGK